MDFMHLLKSLEDLLYELVSWLVFYPVTLWRSITRPGEMMRYADVELGDDPRQQYRETLSPPLFLLITLLIGHGVEASLLATQNRAVLPAFFQTDTNLLIFRAVMFSIFPLVMAVILLGRRRVRLDRDTLRPPFYSQCYVAAPFALGLSFATSMMRVNPALDPAAAALAGAVTLWYLVVQTRWFRRDLGIGWVRAAVLVAGAMLLAGTILLVLAVLIVMALAPTIF